MKNEGKKFKWPLGESSITLETFYSSTNAAKAEFL